MPDYLSFFSGSTRLRSCHLDSLSFVSNLQPSNINSNQLNKSFFYRTFTEWNALPLEIRQTDTSSAFKNELVKHLWKGLFNNDDEPDDVFEADYLGDSLNLNIIY